jgi:hypothetical protein
MATLNRALSSLTKEDVITISNEFLRGWQNLGKYGFRLAGLNAKRRAFGLDELTKAMSDDYRVTYVTEHYDADEIVRQLEQYLLLYRVDEQRWKGIELFDCRFGREYARLFKRIVGAKTWRKISEKARVAKLSETQMQLYGGIGLGSDKAHAKAVGTWQNHYGTDNPMKSSVVTDSLVSPFSDAAVRRKANRTKVNNIRKQHRLSRQETVVYDLLCQRFGENDIICQYGQHPSDGRYPFNCDFYIVSQDLFIEMNGHYSHGNHWFDENSSADCLRRQQLLDSGKRHNIEAVRTWCNIDVQKRAAARKSGIRYLVFWDGRWVSRKDNTPRLSDFRRWFFDYDCDYDSFVSKYPENTY